MLGTIDCGIKHCEHCMREVKSQDELHILKMRGSYNDFVCDECFEDWNRLPKTKMKRQFNSDIAFSH